MSRGFVKEGDQEETPIIPPRAALPDGVVNYVTPLGLESLKEERKIMEKERSEMPTHNETERRRELAIIQGKLDLLQERIVSARVLDPEEQPKQEVRFGATVTYMDIATKKTQKITIVGVDEADLSKQKIAFVAPIARTLTGHKINETAILTLGQEKRELKILDIVYRN